MKLRFVRCWDNSINVFNKDDFILHLTKKDLEDLDEI